MTRFALSNTFQEVRSRTLAAGRTEASETFCGTPCALASVASAAALTTFAY
jgi:hypothetical protein